MPRYDDSDDSDSDGSDSDSDSRSSDSSESDSDSDDNYDSRKKKKKGWKDEEFGSSDSSSNDSDSVSSQSSSNSSSSNNSISTFRRNRKGITDRRKRKLIAVGLTLFMCLLLMGAALGIVFALGGKDSGEGEVVKDSVSAASAASGASAAMTAAPSNILTDANATDANADEEPESTATVSPSPTTEPTAQPTQLLITGDTEERTGDDDFYNDDGTLDEYGTKVPENVAVMANGDTYVITLPDNKTLETEPGAPPIYYGTSSVLLIQSRNGLGEIFYNSTDDDDSGSNDDPDDPDDPNTAPLSEATSYALINFYMGEYPWYQKNSDLLDYEVSAILCLEHVSNSEEEGPWGNPRFDDDGNPIESVFSICRVNNSNETMGEGKAGTGSGVETELLTGVADYSMPEDCIGGEYMNFSVFPSDTTVCVDVSAFVRNYLPFVKEEDEDLEMMIRKLEEEGGDTEEAEEKTTTEESEEGDIDEGDTGNGEETTPEEIVEGDADGGNIADEAETTPDESEEGDTDGDSASDEKDTTPEDIVQGPESDPNIIDDPTNYKNMMFMIANIKEYQDTSTYFYSRQSVVNATSLFLNMVERTAAPTITANPTDAPTITPSPTISATPEPTQSPILTTTPTTVTTWSTDRPTVSESTVSPIIPSADLPAETMDVPVVPNSELVESSKSPTPTDVPTEAALASASENPELPESPTMSPNPTNFSTGTTSAPSSDPTILASSSTPSTSDITLGASETLPDAKSLAAPETPPAQKSLAAPKTLSTRKSNMKFVPSPTDPSNSSKSPTISPAPTHTAEFAPCGVCGNFASFGPLNDATVTIPRRIAPPQIKGKKASCSQLEILCLDGYCPPSLCGLLQAASEFCGCPVPVEEPCSVCKNENEILASPNTMAFLDEDHSPYGKAMLMTCWSLEESCQDGFCSPSVCDSVRNDELCACAQTDNPTTYPTLSMLPTVPPAPTISPKPTTKVLAAPKTPVLIRPPTDFPSVSPSPTTSPAPSLTAEFAPCGVCGSYPSLVPLNDILITIQSDILPPQVKEGKASCSEFDSLCLQGHCTQELCSILRSNSEFCGCPAPLHETCKICNENEILTSPDTKIELNKYQSPTGKAASMTCSSLEENCNTGFCSPQVCKAAQNDERCSCKLTNPPTTSPTMSLSPTISPAPTYKAKYPRCSICGGDPINFSLREVLVGVPAEIAPLPVENERATCNELESYCEKGYCSPLMCKSFHLSVAELCGCNAPGEEKISFVDENIDAIEDNSNNANSDSDEDFASSDEDTANITEDSDAVDDESNYDSNGGNNNENLTSPESITNSIDEETDTINDDASTSSADSNGDGDNEHDPNSASDDKANTDEESGDNGEKFQKFTNEGVKRRKRRRKRRRNREQQQRRSQAPQDSNSVDENKYEEGGIIPDESSGVINSTIGEDVTWMKPEDVFEDETVNDFLFL